MRALAEMENSGLVPLLMADRAEDLARMHALFARVDGGSELLRAGMVRTMRGIAGVGAIMQTTVGMSMPWACMAGRSRGCAPAWRARQPWWLRLLLSRLCLSPVGTHMPAVCMHVSFGT